LRRHQPRYSQAIARSAIVGAGYQLTRGTATVEGDVAVVHDDVTAYTVAQTGERLWFRTLTGGLGVYDLAEGRLLYWRDAVAGPISLSPDGGALVFADRHEEGAEQLALFFVEL
jgi:hypothetical protein